ncbi:helix-turn-helix domain-containing protein [Nocardia cyriacigeorgica]|uniref:helix-turn-helix domain-containing protein n=1 Tax=Nocardia cyriacigeorgica TaxID=135487 RepID=UPI0018962774|nr:helix-turn-helix domain-containing protein [Nocardia cyriacigeorgica]MBF6085121.1 helix-turn-helix domain-containing protein [Nocardia cyriacigeorgica]
MTMRPLLADYVRERRKFLRLRQTDVAKIADVSVQVVRNLEQGRRPSTDAMLEAIFNALEVPVWFQQHIMHLSHPRMVASRLSADPAWPTRADLADLAAFSGPASYVQLPAFDLIAVNQYHRELFPGLEPGANALEWMLLDPAATDALGDDWYRSAHQMVQAFRQMAVGVVPEKRRLTLIDSFSQSPHWEDMWSTAIPFGQDRVRVMNPKIGQRQSFYVRLASTEMPRRPWWIYRLVPETSPLATGTLSFSHRTTNPQTHKRATSVNTPVDKQV